ncbi:MAG: addiction module protein [Desulfococcaceae bacterium]
MKKTMEDITAELSRLSRKDRLEIARFLLCLDDGVDPEVAASWDDEITERVKAVEDGRAVGMDYGEAMARIESRFGF